MANSVANPALYLRPGNFLLRLLNLVLPLFLLITVMFGGEIFARAPIPQRKRG